MEQPSKVIYLCCQFIERAAMISLEMRKLQVWEIDEKSRVLSGWRFEQYWSQFDCSRTMQTETEIGMRQAIEVVASESVLVISNRWR